MKKLLHIIIIIAIASLCFFGICCSNFSNFDFTGKEETPKDNFELSFISNNVKHTSIIGEIININFNLTPHSLRVPIFFSSYSNNQLIELIGTYFYLNYTNPNFCIINKLKTTDIIFPFHYFW